MNQIIYIETYPRDKTWHNTPGPVVVTGSASDGSKRCLFRQSFQIKPLLVCALVFPEHPGLCTCSLWIRH